MRCPRSRARAGFSLVEMVVVVAIIGILAVIGAGLLNNTVPTWRTRQAAAEFSAMLNRARDLAIVEQTEYRVVITGYDDAPGDGVNHGAYLVQKGNAYRDSTAWDTLPAARSDGTDSDAEGTVELDIGGQDPMPWVSIEEVPTGVDNWTILLSPSGWVANDASDFICDIDGNGTPDGFACVVFFNERARTVGRSERVIVGLSRAGMTRTILPTTDASGTNAGTAGASFASGSSGAGFIGSP